MKAPDRLVLSDDAKPVRQIVPATPPAEHQPSKKAPKPPKPRKVEKRQRGRKG